MGRSKKAATWLSCMILAGTGAWADARPCAEAAERVVRGERGKRIDTFLQRMTGYGFSGAVALATDGEVVLVAGYGSRKASFGSRTPWTSSSTRSRKTRRGYHCTTC